ncbi:MAG: DUF2062 domain-containing protein [Rhodobacteraceae bacterium]|nr:DUF2062 domain-containing protein [Paracoccaceae bacterium]
MRGAQYQVYRVLRLSDSPQRIARGVFAGTFVAFTPLFGVHFILAPALAWTIGGNIVASFIATLICNPLTFPLIAFAAVTLGGRLLGTGAAFQSTEIIAAFTEIWNNFLALFSERSADWESASMLLHTVVFPYVIGGALIGLPVAGFSAWVCQRFVAAYQRRRRGRARARRENRK